MFRDLRDFLAFLDQSGDIFHIWEELSPVQEIAGMIKLLNKKIGSVVFFHRVKGYSTPVVANLLGSEKLLSLAFNTSKDLGEEYLARRFIECDWRFLLSSKCRQQQRSARRYLLF